MLLYDGGDAALASFGPALSRRVTRTLEHLGVELHLQTNATTVDAHGLDITDWHGAISRIEARTVLWTADVAAPPFAHTLAQETGAQQDHSGRLRILPDLTPPGHPEIHVVGDLAARNDLPGAAEVAMQGGWHAAGQVLHAVAGHRGCAGDHVP